MKLSKKILSVFLAAVTAVTMLAVGTTSAFAAGWVSSARSVNFGTWYNEYLGVDADYYYYACKISVPARGKVAIRVQAEEEYPEFDIYKTSNVDNVYASSSGEGSCRTSCDFGYSSGGGYEWEVQTFLLPAGSYYIAFKDFSDQLEFDFRLSYNPSFSNTSLSKVSAKKKAFNAKWKKCSNVSGYQLQYSTKKNMKSAKTYTFKGNKTTSKTVSKLKKKKTYYVRVRTYKTVKINGKNKTYYGKWSSKKAVKTK